MVEALPGILPGTDPELVQVVARKLKKLGVEVMTGAKAKSVDREGRARRGGDRRGRRATRSTIDADKVLVAVGRRPNSEGLGLEAVGVKVEKGFVPVDRRLRTNVPGIYAIGDVAGQPMLAHKASQGGRGGGRGDRRAQGRDGRALHPRGHLQRSGDRHRGHHRRRGREARAAR